MSFTYTATGENAVARSDGAYIPFDPANQDYQAYLEWVAAGNTAAPVPVPPKPTSITAYQFLERFTAAEQASIQQACLANMALMVGLMTGIANGTINLTDSKLATWLNSLAAVNALTPARVTQVLTP